MARQVDLLPQRYTKPLTIEGRATTEGAQVVADGTAYADGVNAYIQAALANPTLLPAEYPALQVTPAPWNVRDIVASYSLGVNSYVVKPVDFAKFVDEVAKAGCYWVLVNRLPGAALDTAR